MRGEQSTLAPTSITTTGLPISVGKMPASAGRSTPCMTPCTILAVAMTAPVLPAERRPSVKTVYDALHHLGGGHDGAGIAGRDEPLRDAVAHQAGGHPHGTVALGPDGAQI